MVWARETTVGYLNAVVPRVEECGDRPTFRFGLHLDHMLTTLAPDVRRGCDILDDSFGSDHRPTGPSGAGSFRHGPAKAGHYVTQG